MSCNNFPSPKPAFPVLDEIVVRGDEFYAMQERTLQVAFNVLNELQGKLFDWQQRNFKKEDTGIEWMALGAAEEVGEVAHVILKARQKIRQHQAGMDEAALNKLADGVADTVIYLMQLCSHAGIDFGKALFATAEEVMARDWKEKKTDGVTK
jgi:NTP pyrophosphatase (non-canonical NTP hydrolase)